MWHLFIISDSSHFFNETYFDQYLFNCSIFVYNAVFLTRLGRNNEQQSQFTRYDYKNMTFRQVFDYQISFSTNSNSFILQYFKFELRKNIFSSSSSSWISAKQSNFFEFEFATLVRTTSKQNPSRTLIDQC